MNNLNEQLFKAVKLNEIDEVKKLIKEGADLNAPKPQNPRARTNYY